jgi:hypothetical protein
MKWINIEDLDQIHYKYWYEKRISPQSPKISLDEAFELLELDKDTLTSYIESRRADQIFRDIESEYREKSRRNSERTYIYLKAKEILINYFEKIIEGESSYTDNKVEKYEFNIALKALRLDNVIPLTKDIIKKRYIELVREKHPNKGGDPAEFTRIDKAYKLLSKLSDEEIQFLSMSGGSKESKLLEYSRKVANNRLQKFLSKEPLPFFTLIEEFENASNLKVVEHGNEKFIFESFLNYMFEEYFSSEEGKQFYFEAYEILNKKEYLDIANLSFIMLENINAIDSSKRDIDTVKMKDTEYNKLFDSFEQTIQKANYDFFTEASKIVPNKISIKFFKDHIYYYKNTNSFEKTYAINSNLEIDKEHYDFNEELYFVNDSVVYLFFIISSYLYMKPNVTLLLEDSINKFSRRLKRTKNKKTKSIQSMLKERKEFNEEELDGEEGR